MKGKPKLHILYDYQLNIYLTVDSVFKYSQKMNKIAHISVRDICKSDFAQNNTTIELNRVSIFFHEIFRINVKSPHDLKFYIRILIQAFKKNLAAKF